MKQLSILKLAFGSCAVIFSQLSNADFVAGIPTGYVCTGSWGTAAGNGDVTLSPLGNAKYGYVVTTDGSEWCPPLSSGGETTGSKLVSNSFTAAAGDSLNFYSIILLVMALAFQITALQDY